MCAAMIVRAASGLRQPFRDLVVPRGQAETLIGARGAGGYPSFTLRSPAGQVITPASVQGAVGSGGYRWVQDPPKDGTYVLLGRPEPGTWGILAAMGPGCCSELVLLSW